MKIFNIRVGLAKRENCYITRAKWYELFGKVILIEYERSVPLAKPEDLKKLIKLAKKELEGKE